MTESYLPIHCPNCGSNRVAACDNCGQESILQIDVIGLDIERLARSMFEADPSMHGPWSDLFHEDMEMWRDKARDIAATYSTPPAPSLKAGGA